MIHTLISYLQRPVRDKIKQVSTERLFASLLIPKVAEQIFLRYCRFGDRQNDGRMRLTKLTSLFKDAGLVDKRRFPVQRVELTFSKLKSKVYHAAAKPIL